MITVIGESLVDIISDPREVGRTQVHPGGSPLNVAVGWRGWAWQPRS